MSTLAAARHRVMSGGFAAIRASRADHWLAPIARGRGLILMGHRVVPAAAGGTDASRAAGTFAPNAALQITPEFLDFALSRVRAAGFEFVGLDEVPARLGADGPRFAAVTFDDGYRDNLEHARPVLQRHGVPWTMFVTTDFAAGTGRLWWVELERAIAGLTQVRLDLDGTTVRLACRDARERSATFRRLYWALRSLPERQLRAAVAYLADEAGLDPAGITHELCLNWTEIAALATDPAVTIGAHTCGHPMLAKTARADLAAEIAESRAILCARLSRPVRHLAYPVGDRASAGPREFAAARAAGFATAVTTRPGHLFPAHRDHLHALPRVSLNGLFQTDAALRALLSGVPFLAWNRGRRLDVA